MNSQIYEEIKNSTKLAHVKEGLIRIFLEIKTAGEHDRIGYVSGAITSDGDDKMDCNIAILEKYTRALQKKEGTPMFFSFDVFGNGVYNKLEEVQFERELREEHFRNFWKMILSSGHITDMYMTPGWERSIGARDEHKTATKHKIRIHNVDESILE